MIRNQWYVILESNEVGRRRPLGVTRLGEKLVVWRQADGRVVCMADRCPHLGAPLCLGKVSDQRLACPFHGFEYDASGQCRYLPAAGQNGPIPKALKVQTYPTYEAHGLIWIYWGEPTPNLQPPAFFEPLEDPRLSYRSFHQHWGVHYSRMAENQLDVMHLPFIHYNTIGRGGRMVVDGPQVRLTGDLLQLWVYNRLDDGTPARKAEELPPPQRRPFLQFRFPNIWHNWISGDMRITIAFAPVDEGHTRLYIRTYQKSVKVPVLRELFHLSSRLGSFIIERQDRRVVITQRPLRSSHRMGEILLSGDGPVIQYRRKRDELIGKGKPSGKP